MANEAPTTRNTGVAQFCFLLGATLSLVAAGATLLTVSLPNGLKFVVAGVAATLTLICAGLAALAQALDTSR